MFRAGTFLLPKKKSHVTEIDFHVRKLSQFILVFILFLPHQLEAQYLSPQPIYYDTLNGTLVISRSTGVPGMFGRFTVLLDGKVFGMLGEKQIIKRKVSSGRHTLVVRDDVAYRQFAETTVKFSINASQQKSFLVICKKKAFETRYRIIVKEVP